MSTPTPLTSEALQAWTKTNPSSKRNTVELFFAGMTKSPPQPPKSPRIVKKDPASPRRENPSEKRDVALVLGELPDENSNVRKESVIKEASAPDSSKRRPKLVDALQPRKSPKSSPPQKDGSKIPRTAKPSKESDQMLALEKAQTSSSNDLLSPRRGEPSKKVSPEAPHPPQGAPRKEEPTKNETVRKTSQKRRSRTNDDAESEDEGELEAPVAKKRKISLESQRLAIASDEEREQRLLERKNRRRARALIVKDRSKSATANAAAAGKAAAAKLKDARSKESKSKSRSKQREDNRVAAASSGSESESDSDSQSQSESSSSEEEEKEKKKKKKKKGTSAEKSYKDLLGRRGGKNKPGNVSKGRLTLEVPSKQIGMFGRGAASSRTKAGAKPLKDLVFSELEFLNRRADMSLKRKQGKRNSTPKPPPREHSSDNSERAEEEASCESTSVASPKRSRNNPRSKKRKHASSPAPEEPKTLRKKGKQSAVKSTVPPRSSKREKTKSNGNLKKPVTVVKQESRREKRSVAATPQPSMDEEHESTKSDNSKSLTAHSAYSLAQRKKSVPGAQPQPRFPPPRMDGKGIAHSRDNSHRSLRGSPDEKVQERPQRETKSHQRLTQSNEHGVAPSIDDLSALLKACDTGELHVPALKGNYLHHRARTYSQSAVPLGFEDRRSPDPVDASPTISSTPLHDDISEGRKILQDPIFDQFAYISQATQVFAAPQQSTPAPEMRHDTVLANSLDSLLDGAADTLPNQDIYFDQDFGTPLQSLDHANLLNPPTENLPDYLPSQDEMIAEWGAGLMESQGSREYTEPLLHDTEFLDFSPSPQEIETQETRLNRNHYEDTALLDDDIISHSCSNNSQELVPFMRGRAALLGLDPETSSGRRKSSSNAFKTKKPQFQWMRSRP